MEECKEIKIVERPISQYMNNTSHVDTSSSSEQKKEKKPATSTQKHIRPKLRKKRNQNVESLIEQTRLQISSLSTQDDRLSALKESLIDQPQPGNVVQPKQGPKGILKPSKYTKPAAMQSYENDTLADELGLPRNDMEPQRTEALPSVAAFVKDTVMEKKIEIPKPVVAKPQVKEIEKEQGPKIIKSLAELIELGKQANAHLEDTRTDENGEKMETMIEAKMEFKCISENEYEAAIEKAKEAGISVEEYVAQQENDTEEDDDEKVSMNIEEEVEEEEQVTIETEDDLFQQDDYMDEDDEEGDMFEFFGEEQHEEEEALPEPELRAFMILWNALKAWITADAVDVLKKYKSECFIPKDDSEGYRITKQDPFGKSKKEQPCDVHLSRCAGLMNMLKMNLTKCLDDCGYSADDGYTIKTAETRLYEFVQFFDYSEPMVKFHSDMWKALTVILLNIVLPRHDLAFEGKSGIIVQDNAELTLPPMLREVGITVEEYKYLVNSAIPSLDLGS